MCDMSPWAAIPAIQRGEQYTVVNIVVPSDPSPVAQPLLQGFLCVSCRFSACVCPFTSDVSQDTQTPGLKQQSLLLLEGSSAGQLSPTCLGAGGLAPARSSCGNDRGVRTAGNLRSPFGPGSDLAAVSSSSFFWSNQCLV